MKTLLVIALLISFVLVSGCAIFSKPAPKPPAVPTPATTATQQQVVRYVDRIAPQTNWLTTVCLIGMGLGFFAFLSGNGMGLKIMASCAVIICGALILASVTAWIVIATKWILILAFAAAVLGLGSLGYAIFVKGKALKEIVLGIHQVKNEGVPLTVALSKQSGSTRAVVSAVKKSLRIVQ